MTPDKKKPKQVRRPPVDDPTQPPSGTSKDLAGPGARPPLSKTVPTTGSRSQPSLPANFPGYHLLGELGRGGMGVVYKAEQLGLKRLVAIKVILNAAHADAETLARFHAEAESFARVKHPGVVQVYDIGVHDDRPFLVLEFIEGGNLAKRLSGKTMEPLAAAKLVAKLARTMHAVHAKGIIHRDLKPANVLLAEDGEPKITDFGLARQMEAAGLTATGMILGSPSYMAPEQAAGRKNAIGPTTDVWALGAILYQMLTGWPPFREQTPVDTIMAVLSKEPQPPSRLRRGLPPALEAVCLKCLQKDQGRRYASAAELAADLDKVVQKLTAPPPRKRSMLPTVFLALCLLLLMATGAFIGARMAFPSWFESRPPEQTAPATPKPQPINLLDKIELPRDRVAGEWKKEGGKLTTPGGTSGPRIEIPYTPPPSYKLELEVKREADTKQGLMIGLVVGGRQTTIVIDFWGQSMSGLEKLDNKVGSDNPTTHKGQLLKLNVPTKLVVEVWEEGGEAHITFTSGGATIINNWHGQSSRLSLLPIWQVPHKDVLFLGAGDKFTITKFELTPLAPKEK